MAFIRTERARVLWAAESTFGSISNGTYRRFGLHDTIEAPDPEFAWEPYFGVFSTRDRATIMRGQASLRGSIPDIRLQSGLTTFVSTHVLRPAAGGANENLAPFTLYVAYLDTGGNLQLQRYYTGGKINRASISANEGQELRLNIDEMLFRKMYHSRSGNDGYVSRSAPSVPTIATAGGRYMFAHGSVSIAGVTFDRVRRFNLSVDNQIEPRYYIQRDSTTGILYPNDLIEGRRVWRVEVDVDIINPAAGGDLELWDFLINQGAAGSGATLRTSGGLIILTFAAVGGLGGSLQFVCGGSPSTLQPSGVLASAPHSIPAPPAGLVTVTASFDVDTVTVGTP